jgi:hypothetical protein
MFVCLFVCLNNYCQNIQDSSNSGEDYFEKFQQIQKKKESLETKERVSHRVYCPYFPDVINLFLIFNFDFIYHICFCNYKCI